MRFGEIGGYGTPRSKPTLRSRRCSVSNANIGAFLRFTMEYPDFHHFMLRENRPGNPRLPWLTHVVIQPLLQRVLPQIRACQATGELPQGDPVLIHYMLIGAASVLSSLGAEISEATGLVPYSPSIVDSYWTIIEQTIFRAAPHRQPLTEAETGTPNLAAGLTPAIHAPGGAACCSCGA